MRIIKQYDTEYEIVDDGSGDSCSTDPELVSEEVHFIDPNELDPEDTVVSEAMRLMQDAGAIEPSCWPSWSPGTWYTTEPVMNYHTGVYSESSFHLEGWTQEEEEEIYRAFVGARR